MTIGSVTDGVTGAAVDHTASILKPLSLERTALPAATRQFACRRLVLYRSHYECRRSVLQIIPRQSAYI